MRIRVLTSNLIALSLLVMLPKITWGITADQLELLNSLPPSQQASILKAVTKNKSFKISSGRKATSDQNSTKSEPIEEQKLTDESSSIREQTGETILRIGDNIIVYFEPANVKDKTKQKSEKLKSDRETFVPDQNRILYTLNSRGEILIEGIGRILIAGLTESEAAARISLEPLLSSFQIEVMILPLQKFGASELKPFGYELFKQESDQMLPDVSMPVPENYLVGPGDQINIQLLGKENQDYLLEVSRDSTLSLPEIGTFPVTGLNFDELKRDLKKRIKRKLIGTDAFITLGELRSIRVFVLGEVEKPGAYSVSGLSTMTNALLHSRGVTEIGSLRHVELKRQGKLIKKLDLYDLLLHGNTRHDERLRPGDVIHIPTIKKSVAISGDIRRPAIYELNSEKTINDVISLAGGLLPTAFNKSVRVERITGADKQLIEIDLSDKTSGKFELQSGDIVTIDSVLDRQENVVLLKGDVLRPGQHQWHSRLKLTDVIPSLRALKDTADPEYIVIKRYLEPTYELKVLSASLRKAISDPGGVDNIFLKPRDEIMVFSLNKKRVLQMMQIIKQLEAQSKANEPTKAVRVIGQVRGPGKYPLEPDMRVSDLVIAGGRLIESAYTVDAELTRFITRPGQAREIIHVNINLGKAMAGDESQNMILKPYDLLNIKEIPLWQESDQVELVGEVQFPGKYAIQRGETLFELLNRAGGLTDHAYPQGAVFMREDLRKREQERMDAMAANLEAELATISLERSGDPTEIQSAGTAQQLLSKLRTTEAAGRLVIDLEKIAKGDFDKQDKDQVIMLRGGDKLYIPSKMQEVSVIGQVFHPTSHLYSDNLDVDDYINLSGGMTKKADDDSVYIIRANGAVQVAQSTWLDESPDIKPGDTVVVPLDAERISSLKLWSSISQIVYQLGLSAAAWNTIVK